MLIEKLLLCLIFIGQGLAWKWFTRFFCRESVNAAITRFFVANVTFTRFFFCRECRDYALFGVEFYTEIWQKFSKIRRILAEILTKKIAGGASAKTPCYAKVAKQIRRHQICVLQVMIRCHINHRNDRTWLKIHFENKIYTFLRHFGQLGGSTTVIYWEKTLCQNPILGKKWFCHLHRPLGAIFGTFDNFP